MGLLFKLELLCNWDRAELWSQPSLFDHDHASLILLMLWSWSVEWWKGLAVLVAGGRREHVSGSSVFALHSLFLPPTLKKLEGHIASGAFVYPSFCRFVCSSRILMHSIPWELSKLLFRNFLYGFLIKNSWHIFFSQQDYAPFLSYGPLKKYGCNLVSKISQKLLKLEPWNLTNRLVVMSSRPD